MSIVVFLAVIWALAVVIGCVVVVRGIRPPARCNRRGGRLMRWLAVSRSFFS